MSFINRAAKELNLKIIYYGPGLSGKTTNIQHIYQNTHSPNKGSLMTMSSENERTLFFDFLPLASGKIRGYDVRAHLYSIPGQTFYETSREFILKGVDGIVFVADSQEERMESNIESLEAMEKSLTRQGYDIQKIPLVFQYNKRDCTDKISIKELEATLNPMKRPYFEAIANQGDGVMQTFEKIYELVIHKLKGGSKYEEKHY